MWNIIVNVLSYLGIALLVLSGIILLALLLILFYPITYRGKGNIDQQNKDFVFRAIWLFGLLRAYYRYPEPGNLEMKLLWFPLFPKKEEASEREDRQTKENTISEHSTDDDTQEEAVGSNSTTNENYNFDTNLDGSTDSASSNVFEEALSKDTGNPFKKIKYTIHSIYVKIRKVVRNISFYLSLLQEQNSIDLWNHVKVRLIKILKSIRPRYLYADITFGTGEPDTTGYVLAIYSIFSPHLGKRVNLTPDFEEKTILGRIKFSGHITLFTIIWHCLMVALDKKLRIFMDSYKAGRK